MHRNVLLFFAGCIYYSLSVYGLFSFDAGLLLSSVILFGIPAYFLARYSAAPFNVLVSVMILGAGLAILLEGIAHIYGIWYTVGVDELRLLGLVPIEVIFSSVLQTLFLVLLYELVFDDGEYTTSHQTVRFTAFGVFFISAISLVAIHEYVLRGIFFTHSYLWIIGILIASTLATLAVARSLNLRFFDRLFSFTVIALIPLSASLVLAVSNSQKIFAYAHDYLYTFYIHGNMLPIEEVVLMLAMPLFVATFYELYLDDGELKSE